MNETKKQAFDRLFGMYELKNSDAAWHVFSVGYRTALAEAAKRVQAMPFGDTSDSLAVYLKNIIEE